MTVASFADRLCQSSVTTGTGALTLGAALTGFQAISAKYSINVDLPYVIEGLDPSGGLTGEWETGRGHLDGSGHLVRALVYDSSNGGSAVSFTSATLRVFVDTTATGLTEWLANNASPLSGSGAAGRVAFWTGSQALSSSSLLGWDGASFSIGATTPVAANSVPPVLYLQKDIGTPTASNLAGAVVSLVNSSSGGYTELVLGQAHDLSDGNYSGFLNVNSGFTPDGLIEPGTTAFAAQSAQSTAKMLFYTSGGGKPIVFCTTAHSSGNERGRFMDDGLRIPAGMNIGVGTASGSQTQSSADIEITRTTDALMRITTSGATSALQIKFQNASTDEFAIEKFSNSFTNFGGSIHPGWSSVRSNGTLGISTSGAGGFFTPADIVFLTTAGTNPGAAAERMRIKELGNITYQVDITAYALNITLDFRLPNHQTIAMTGLITFSSSNLTAGSSMEIEIITDGSPHGLLFPAPWTFVGGAAPATQAANKRALLRLFSWGTSDTDVTAEYIVQP